MCCLLHFVHSLLVRALLGQKYWNMFSSFCENVFIHYYFSTHNSFLIVFSLHLDDRIIFFLCLFTNRRAKNILVIMIYCVAYRGRAWLRMCQELTSSHLSESLSVSLLWSCSWHQRWAKTKIGFKKDFAENKSSLVKGDCIIAGVRSNIKIINIKKI